MVIEIRRPPKKPPPQTITVAPVEYVALSRVKDGFIALVGPNGRDGIAGFGSTPPKALRDLADRIEIESYPLRLLDF
jgi:hypothetical protein